jgi:hypothetical protein
MNLFWSVNRITKQMHVLCTVDAITEPVFVNLLRSPGIDTQPGGIDSSEPIPGLHKRLQIRAQLPADRSLMFLSIYTNIYKTLIITSRAVSHNCSLGSLPISGSFWQQLNQQQLLLGFNSVCNREPESNGESQRICRLCSLHLWLVYSPLYQNMVYTE